jgi:urease accessory protein
VLGAAIAFTQKVPLSFACASVAFFALMHGHAHGEELPLIANAAAYAVGFTLSTAALHLLGIRIGIMAQHSRTKMLALRATGGAMGVFGAILLARVL